MEDTLRQFRANLGVEISMKVVPLTGIAKAAGQQPPHMALFGWGADYPDPDNFLRVGLEAKWAGWQRQVIFDEIVAEARHLLDHEERIRRYQQADLMLIEDAVILPLAHSMLHFLVKPWVVNHSLSPIELKFWKDVILEDHS